MFEQSIQDDLVHTRLETYFRENSRYYYHSPNIQNDILQLSNDHTFEFNIDQYVNNYKYV